MHQQQVDTSTAGTASVPSAEEDDFEDLAALNRELARSNPDSTEDPPGYSRVGPLPRGRHPYFF
jgi:hypothetical protein